MIAYIDGWGYQDNLLPEYMANAGHDVVVITNNNKFPSYLHMDERNRILEKGNNYYDGKVKVYRIPIGLATSNYAFICRGLTRLLKKEQPDVIFHHGVNSSSMIICCNYVRNHRYVKFFVDNHADMLNQSRNVLWNKIITRGLMRLCICITNQYITKYYGVTPGRCEYLETIYGADSTKINLMPIGCDTNRIDNISDNIKDLRQKYCIPLSSRVICSGGKMGVQKGTLSLIKAFKKLCLEGNDLCLILFGRFLDEETQLLANQTNGVHIFGWCDRITTLELLKLSDIGCWPIHHTTLIEDAIGTSLPLIVRRTSNTEHLIQNNGEFVSKGNEDELYNVLKNMCINLSMYKDGAKVVKDQFSYNNIVKQFEKDCN